jgi:antitoxin VapB
MPMEVPLETPRPVRLFRNGRNQAVRIPREFELPGQDALMSREGDALVIRAIRRRSLLEVLGSLDPLDEDFPEIDDPLPERARL